VKTDLVDTMLSLLNLEPTVEYAILDFGCGTGEFLGRVAGRISHRSPLVGTDAMERPILQARSTYGSIQFRREKFVDSFSFPTATFDIVASTDALECVPNKAALLSEVSRILKPGGRVAFAHWDWDTQVYNSAHKEPMRNLIAAFSDWKQDWMDDSDGQMGRKLWALLEGSGRFTGSIHCHTRVETTYQEGQYGFDRLRDMGGLVRTGRISAADYEMILQEMSHLAQTGEYFYSVNSYIYIGKKLS